MSARTATSVRRLRSRQRLLAVIREHQGITRADLIAVTGLSRSAVAAGVQDLLAGRLVAEEALPARGKGSGRGRPSTLLVPTTGAGVVGALDFGHAHLAAAIAGTDGTVLVERRTAVAVDSLPTVALDTAARLVRELLADCGRPLDDVRSIAAGIPAPLDARTNRPRSVLAKWNDVDVAGELEARIGMRTTVANDAELGAQGELRFGAVAAACREALDPTAALGA